MAHCKAFFKHSIVSLSLSLSDPMAFAVLGPCIQLKVAGIRI